MTDRLIFLNSNDGTGLLAFSGSNSYIHTPAESFSKIQKFIDKNTGDYIFQLLSYDLKNQLEKLTDSTTNYSGFPLAIFWVPEFVVKIENESYHLLKGKLDANALEIITPFLNLNDESTVVNELVTLQPRTSKEEYIKHVGELLDEIQYGNIYEVNFCQEFYNANATVKSPLALYSILNKVTEAPFSVYAKFDEFHVFCGSPERYIKKQGSTLLSQPIKGTIKKGQTTEEDIELVQQLKNDPKEIAENVMIVDLVRNDLSRVAAKNSVEVSELCGIYSFKTVHQMISTIQCTLKEGRNWSDIIRATFPMGSMTGAPKISAMNLIDAHEDFSRGIYSGSIGYIDPSGDFDMNVVIRSVYYNSKTKYMSCGVGGAITIQSNPEKEYEECFTKVSSILNCLNGKL